MTPDERLELFAALAEPSRLAAIGHLWLGDLTPGELGTRLGVPSNLLAHHLDVLGRVGLVSKRRSAGDRRRRYLVLRHERVAGFGLEPLAPPAGPPVFLSETGRQAAIAADRWWLRTGARVDALDLGSLLSATQTPATVVTVSDSAREHGGVRPRHLLHWGTAAEEDATFIAEIDTRIDRLAHALGLTRPAERLPTEERPDPEPVTEAPPAPAQDPEPDPEPSPDPATPEPAVATSASPPSDPAPYNEPADLESRLLSLVRSLRPPQDDET